MKWTQNELEELYKKANAKAASDKEFRKSLIEDSKDALEKLAGRELPDDFNLKLVEKDNNYGATYVVPDFPKGELDLNELRDEDLESVNGGISMVGIVGVCVGAVEVGDDDVNYCVGNACPGKSCDLDGCTAETCLAYTCDTNYSQYEYCTMQSCPEDTCHERGCHKNC